MTKITVNKKKLTNFNIVAYFCSIKYPYTVINSDNLNYKRFDLSDVISILGDRHITATRQESVQLAWLVFLVYINPATSHHLLLHNGRSRTPTLQAHIFPLDHHRFLSELIWYATQYGCLAGGR